MDTARDRLHRLDLPLPLEPLLLAALEAEDDLVRVRSARAAVDATVRMYATTLAIAEGGADAPWMAALVTGDLVDAMSSMVTPSAHAGPHGCDAATALRAGLADSWDGHAVLGFYGDALASATGAVPGSTTDVLRALAVARGAPSELPPEVVCEVLLAVLERVAVAGGGSYCACLEGTSWVAFHGASPYAMTLAPSEMADAGTPGWMDADGTWRAATPWVALEVHGAAARLGWLVRALDPTTARYDTYLAGTFDVRVAVPLATPVPSGVHAPRVWPAWALAGAMAAVAAGGWVRSWRLEQRAVAVERSNRRVLRGPRSLGQILAHETGAESATGADSGVASGNATTPVATAVDTRESVARRARAMVLSAQLGHEAEALAAAVRATGQAQAAGLPEAEQSLDVLSSALAALRHSFPLYGRRDGGFCCALAPGGRRALLIDARDRAQIWEPAHRHVIATLRPPPGPLVSAAFASDGQALSTVGADGVVTVWNARTGNLLHDAARGRGAWFSRDGARVALARDDGALDVFATHDGHALAELRGHRATVTVASFSPDGERIAAASDDGTVLVWHVADGVVLATLTPSTAHVSEMRFSPDGLRLITVGALPGPAEDRGGAAASAHATQGSSWTLRGVEVWDASRPHALAALDEALESPAYVIAPTGDRMLTLSTPSGAVLWSTRTGERIAQLPVDAHAVAAAEFAPNGALLLVGDATATRLWDASTGALRRTLPAAVRRNAGFATFTPDGEAVFTSGEGGDGLFNVESGERELLLRGNTGGVTALSFDPAGERMMTVGRDGVVRIWDADGGELIESLAPHTATVLGAAFLGDGAHAFSAGNDGVLRVWDENPSQATTSWHHTQIDFDVGPDRAVIAGASGPARIIEIPSGSTVTTLVGSPANPRVVRAFRHLGRIVVVDRRGGATVWDASTGERVREVASAVDHGEPRVLVSGNGAVLLVARADGVAALWDLAAGTRLAEYSAELFQTNAMSLSFDGARLLTQSPDGSVDLREARTGQRLARLGDEHTTVVDLAFSPDGTQVATASPDGPVRIWDATSGHAVAELDEYATVLRYAPDGAFLAVGLDGEGRGAQQGTTRGIVRVWNVRERRIVATLDGHAGVVTSVAFSADGSRLVSTSDDRTARLWDVATGTLLATYLGHGADVTSAAFSLDGQWVRTTSGDGVSRLFPASGTGLMAAGCTLLRTQPEVGNAGGYCGGGQHGHAHESSGHVSARHE